MATISPVSTTFASKTTPKDPFPMIRSAEYEIFCSVIVLLLPSPDPPVALLGSEPIGPAAAGGAIDAAAAAAVEEVPSLLLVVGCCIAAAESDVTLLDAAVTVDVEVIGAADIDAIQILARATRVSAVAAFLARD